MKARISKQDGSVVSANDETDECSRAGLRASATCLYHSSDSDEYPSGGWWAKKLVYSQSVEWLDVLGGKGLVQLTLPPIDQPCASQRLDLKVLAFTQTTAFDHQINCTNFIFLVNQIRFFLFHLI